MMSDKLNRIFESDDLGLLNTSQHDKPQTSSDRLEASFLEIVDFYNEHNYEPSAKTTEMAERKLGVRLRGIRADDNKIEALKHLDSHGLLVPEAPPESIDEVFSDDTLGLFDDPTGILTLKNVTKTKKPAEDYVARRQHAKDFESFEPMFIKCHNNLKNGVSKLVQFETERQIMAGRFYIQNGVMALVAHMEPRKRNRSGDLNARMRIIYENGTESNALLRSFARVLYDDGKIVVGPDDEIIEELNAINDDDSESGYIYILSSLNEDPTIGNISDLYKIGFSTTSVEQRIKGAENDPTYLMGPVRIVATYKAFNMNTQKFELLLHRVFNEVRLNMDMIDRNGRHYTPSEWFVVPVGIIDTAIRMIISGDIVHYVYNKDAKTLEENN
jgi:hypothetical protein